MTKDQALSAIESRIEAQIRLASQWPYNSLSARIHLGAASLLEDTHRLVALIECPPQRQSGSIWELMHRVVR